MPYCIQPLVWTKTASKIRKLKCKAGLSTTLMKSHIKPSRESMCTGGNENEAKPTGSSAFYLVSLPSFSPLSLPCLSLPMQFPPISLPDLLFPPFLLAIFITFPFTLTISLSPSFFPLTVPFLLPQFFFFPVSLLLPPSLRLFPPFSICRCHIWQLSAPD